ncbi:hypothetical protein ACQPZF_24370 [Actinosynnema sp. CS-041913]|uniref:hypothetical protein n=1 Tax=Actinosynnema sp. CS-041913 TaxID=3239917 RepID=UPI003D90C8D7
MSSLLRRTARLLSGTLLVGALVSAMAPATAVAATPTTADSVGVLSYQATYYGYTGTFRDATVVQEIDWFSSGRLEAFGIAPDRTIWHAWPGSGGWWQMPHNGRADHVTSVAWNQSTGMRLVEVYVASGGGSFWCSTDPGNGSWGPWQRC